ncbi:MAG: hypothetical protein ABIF08_03390 [Nanoarchaeota archaeon]
MTTLRTLLLLLVALFIIGCGGGGGENPVTPPPDGKTCIGVDLPVDANDSTVFFGSGSAPLGPNGSLRAKLNSNCTQAVFVFKGGNLLGAATVLDTANRDTITITPKATAETFVLLAPHNYKGTIERNKSAMNIIRSLSTISDFESAIRTNLENTGTIYGGSEPNNLFRDEFSNVLTELFSNEQFRQAAWNIIPNNLSGLQIRDADETAELNDFEAINSRRRYVDVYDGDSLLVSVKSMGFSSLYQTVKESFDVDVAGRENITLTSYGPGVGNIPELGTEEINRLVTPTLKSAVFDVALPTVSIVFGLSGMGSENAAIEIVTRMLADGVFINSVVQGIYEEDYFNVTVSIVFKTVDILITDALENGVNSILIRYLGTETALTVFEWVLLPIKVISMTLKAIDLALAVVAYTTSNAVDEFYLADTTPTDTDPPVWDSTVGITNAISGDGKVTVYWGTATDAQNPPTRYLIYKDSDNHPWDQTPAVKHDINPHIFSGLANGQEYFFGVRCQDAVNNVDTNTIVMSATPEAGSGVPDNPVIVGSVDTDYAWDIDVLGNYVYIAERSFGLKVIDITDKTNPIIVGSVDTDNAWDVDVSGNYAYVADKGEGLRIIDVTNKSNPVIVASVGDSVAEGVDVLGNYAYVSGSSLEIIDVTNKTSPVVVSMLGVGINGNNIRIVGNYAYVTDAGNGLKVIDVSDKSNPTVVGSVDTDDAWDVDVSGNYAYVGDQVAGLKVIDISNKTNPTVVGSVDDIYALGVIVSGDYVYAACTISAGWLGYGFQIVNVSSKSNPSMFEHADVTEWAWDVAVSNNYAYVADDEAGLTIFKLW